MYVSDYDSPTEIFLCKKPLWDNVRYMKTQETALIETRAFQADKNRKTGEKICRSNRAGGKVACECSSE